MHAEHVRLLAELERLAPPPERRPPAGYLGQGDHPLLGVPVPVKRKLARAWAQGREAAAVLQVAESLYGGASYDEKTLASMLLGQHRAAREVATPLDVERWMGGLQGWAEVDHLCQNLFPAEQLLADWTGWSAMLRRLAQAAEPSRRRAALVLLVGPLRRCTDPRLAKLALENVERLRRERDPLITKAVSWVLRALVFHHRQTAERYLEAHAAELPPIAVRETRAKLDTGVKSGRRSRAAAVV